MFCVVHQLTLGGCHFVAELCEDVLEFSARHGPHAVLVVRLEGVDDVLLTLLHLRVLLHDLDERRKVDPPVCHVTITRLNTASFAVDTGLQFCRSKSEGKTLSAVGMSAKHLHEPKFQSGGRAMAKVEDGDN